MSNYWNVIQHITATVRLQEGTDNYR